MLSQSRKKKSPKRKLRTNSSPDAKRNIAIYSQKTYREDSQAFIKMPLRRDKIRGLS